MLDGERQRSAPRAGGGGWGMIGTCKSTDTTTKRPGVWLGGKEKGAAAAPGGTGPLRHGSRRPAVTRATLMGEKTRNAGRRQAAHRKINRPKAILPWRRQPSGGGTHLPPPPRSPARPASRSLRPRFPLRCAAQVPTRRAARGRAERRTTACGAARAGGGRCCHKPPPAPPTTQRRHVPVGGGGGGGVAEDVMRGRAREHPPPLPRSGPDRLWGAAWRRRRAGGRGGNGATARHRHPPAPEGASGGGAARARAGRARDALPHRPSPHTRERPSVTLATAAAAAGSAPTAADPWQGQRVQQGAGGGGGEESWGWPAGEWRQWRRPTAPAGERGTVRGAGRGPPRRPRPSASDPVLPLSTSTCPVHIAPPFPNPSPSRSSTLPSHARLA